MLTSRPRPMPQLVVAHGYSFPSGHVFSAVTIYSFLIYMIWGMYKIGALRFVVLLISIFMIFLIGISKIYLNVHYLTDVLGGYAAGIAWLIFCIVTVNTIRSIIGVR
jgi:undecaprenyl-diphosphatase